MILSIDIGGTKTLIGLFSEQGKLVEKRQFATNNNYDFFLKELKQLISNKFWRESIHSISIAVPGIVDHSTKKILGFGNLSWGQIDIKKDIESEFKRKVFIDNDANVGALAAVNDLEEIPELAVYISLGTGIGTAVVENGSINKNLSHSEGGHILVLINNKLIEWEDIASGKAIVEYFGKFASEITDEKQWEEIAQRVSLGLFTIVPLLQPQVIIFGGGIGTYFRNFNKQLESMLDKNMPDFIKIPSLIAAKSSEDAVIYGGFILAKQKS